jgi:WD40 repeat protein
MAIDLATGVVRILDSTGDTVGAGFVVKDNGLIVTCAHVVISAGAGPGQPVQVVFLTTGEERWANVDLKCWREPAAEDVAFLRMDGPLPAGVAALPLGSSGGVAGHPLKAIGFPPANPVGGILGEGKIYGELTLNDVPVLEIRSQEVTGGFSGGPVLDAVTRRVVGMVTSIAVPDKYGKLAEIAFITPSETLRRICPELVLSDICPYKGLAAFTEEDAEFFFGREALANKMWAQLRRHPRLLVVVGASGSGKTSVIQTKLVPKLRQQKLISFRPDKDPFRRLAEAGLTAPDNEDLLEAARKLLDAAPELRRLIILADQFEELFSQCDEKGQTGLMNSLTRLLDSDLPVTIILILRADFYGHLLRYADFLTWLQDGLVNVGPMSREELKAVVDEPAKEIGLRFEDGLVDRIVDEAAQIDHPLPLLESALTQLWEKREDGFLTWSAFKDIGITGSIGMWAEDAYSALDQSAKALAKRVFTSLIRFSKGEEADTRQRLTLGELVRSPGEHQVVHRLVTKLADRHLLVTGGEQTGTVEIIHDALLREWARLQRWRTEFREFRLWQQRLKARYEDWQRQKEDEGALLRGALLVEAEKWLSEQESNLDPGERDYIQRSVALRERELAEEIQAANRLRRRAFYLSAALVVALVALIGTIVFANKAQTAAQAEIEARQTAVAERNLSRSRELAVSAVANLETDPERSMLLAMEAITPTYTMEAEDALRRAIQASRVEHTLVGHTGAVNSVAYSPTAMRLATASDDGTVRIWDTVSGQTVLTWTAHSSPIRSIAFNQDGTRLATASDDHTAKLWDAGTGQQMVILVGHTGAVNGVAFSPDGTRLATASGDTTARVWNVAPGSDPDPLTLEGHTGVVNDVAFSPDGRRLATVGADTHAIIWDAISGDKLLALPDSSQAIFGVAFGPCLNPNLLARACDAYLATGGRDKTVRIWELTSGAKLLRTLSDPSTVYGVAFSPDGKRLASSSADRTAKVWDIATGEMIWSLAGHRGPVNRVAFSLSDAGRRLATASSDGEAKIWNVADTWAKFTAHSKVINKVVFGPDGTYLVTTSLDGTAKVWDVASHQLLTTLTNHTGGVIAAAFNPEGSQVATTSLDGTVKVWDTQSWQELHTLALGVGVGDVAFSPDGTRLAATSFDGEARVWDALSWQQVVTLSGHTAPVFSIAFSPDGSLLATGSQDETVRLWEAASGRFLRMLRPEAGAVFSLAFNPTLPTQLVTSTGDGTSSAKVWNVTTGELLYTLKGHTAQVNSLAFNQDGTLLVTASSDRLVKLWGGAAQGYQTHLTLPEHADQVTSVAFSPDQKYLAVSLGDGTVQLHSLDINDVLTAARERLTRGWRPEECQEYLHQEECPPKP